MAATTRRIVILIASVREGRKSDRVAMFFRDHLSGIPSCEAEILDLKEYNFPVFTERLKFQKDPSEKAIEFARRIRESDGVLIVTPEYNGGYPAALKNATDLLTEEWKRKPVAISTVSGGPFAGSQVITSLLFTLWKIGAWVVPAMFPVPRVEETFSAEGKSADPAVNKRAEHFTGELFYAIDAQRSLSGK